LGLGIPEVIGKIFTIFVVAVTKIVNVVFSGVWGNAWKILMFLDKQAFNFDLWCSYPYLGGGHEMSSMCAANP
jgi:hypothetical protein